MRHAWSPPQRDVFHRVPLDVSDLAVDRPDTGHHCCILAGRGSLPERAREFCTVDLARLLWLPRWRSCGGRCSGLARTKCGQREKRAGRRDRHKRWRSNGTVCDRPAQRARRRGSGFSGCLHRDNVFFHAIRVGQFQWFDHGNASEYCNEHDQPTISNHLDYSKRTGRGIRHPTRDFNQRDLHPYRVRLHGRQLYLPRYRNRCCHQRQDR